MATASLTWAAWSGIQLVADVGDSASIAAAISATDGNPAPSLEWTGGAVTAISERARKTTTDSWETLFGIPAGSTVTDAQVTGWDELNWTANLTSRRVRIRLVDGAGVTVHSAGELVDITGTPSNNTGAPAAKGAGTSRAVDAGSQPSATGVRLEVQVDITSTGAFDLEQDNVVVQITYTLGGVTTVVRVILRSPGMRGPS